MKQGEVNEKYQVSSFYVLFLIHSVQIGISILNFQAPLAKAAGTSGWLSLIIAGFSINLIIWVIYKIFSLVPGDIVTVNRYVFGKWIGNILNLILVLHFLGLSLITISSYTDIVHVWMFQEVPSWCIAFALLLLSYYIISGGFRTVNGIAFFSITLSYWLLFLAIYVFKYADLSQLHPIVDHSLLEIAKESKQQVFTMMGFETLIVFYPFIKNAKSSQKYAQIGVLCTTVLLIFVYMVTLSFYSLQQLLLHIWPTLSLAAIVEFSFLQRFEIIIVSWWVFVIIPNLVLTLWSASRIVKRAANIQQKYPLLVMMALLFFILIIFNYYDITSHIVKWITPVGSIIIYFYLPILLVIIWIKHKVRKKT
ncbi:GerAB/ArcD/ProY family transporter [Bacillus massiliigorillae]|uniref:GerAB/ArcD/ProY family transporter n=1 Tax=Bacillus massiliigorillae TaxID=1243664 RepID=UPI0003A9D5C0|nr:GerAB/ArcD/ProY family transporter [Bacillus massiliigorillae]